jgi:hypothetical protein
MFTPKKHQERLIAQGICPKTLRPMEPKYYIHEEFIVYHSPATDMVYYAKPTAKQVMQQIGKLFKDMWGHIRFFLISRTFEYEVKINGAYPVHKLKRYEPK